MEKDNLKDIAWEKVKLARDPKRPTAKVLVEYLFTSFVQLHGDRLFSDDPSIIAGIGLLDDLAVTVIAQEKGTSTEGKIFHNFGMTNPEGYRKALRLMRQAEKFGRPIVTIIDTPGAYPGVGAEERGQGAAIATNLMEMASFKVPIIAIVLGEGGSGGALGIGVGDRIWMFENSIYSILSPEGFASILYKDATLAKEIAKDMKLTASDLLNYGIIDYIIPEGNGGLSSNFVDSFKILKEELIKELRNLKKLNEEELLSKRYNKYRKVGIYEEVK